MGDRPAADSSDFPAFTHFLGDLMSNEEVYGGDEFTPKKILPSVKVIPVVEAASAHVADMPINKEAKSEESIEANQPADNGPINFPWFEEMLKQADLDELEF